MTCSLERLKAAGRRLAAVPLAMSMVFAVVGVAQAQPTGAGKPALQQTASAADDLAKQLANPIASLISVPFQANWDFGIGESDATRFILNVQPVIPFSLNDRWNLITRTIVPITSLGSVSPGVEGATGLGDTVQSFFFSPKEPVGGWIMGGGPALLYPTATDPKLGAGQWAAGPTVVVLQQKGPVTYGGLFNHLWTFAGHDDRDPVNASFFNPFVSYITSTKTTFSVSPELTYDWEHEQWLAPVNFMVSQLVMFGRQPVSIGGGYRYYFEGPSGSPAWGVRFAVVLLFPK